CQIGSMSPVETFQASILLSILGSELYHLSAGRQKPLAEISCMDSGKPCDSSCMRDIRRAFQRKPFHLWLPATAAARAKRRNRFLRLPKRSPQRATTGTSWDQPTCEAC